MITRTACLLAAFALPPLATAGQGPDRPTRGHDGQPEPVQCWWRTSAAAVRVAEPFSLLLTCALADADARQVVVDQAKLGPEAIPLAPFEVVGGGDLTEVGADGRRLFQRDYRVRVVSDAAFGSVLHVPEVVVTYRLQSGSAGDDRTRGIERRHALPPLPVQVLSLVPAEATDIRELPVGTFADLDAAGFRATLLTWAGSVLLALGALGLAAAVVAGVRRRPAARAAIERLRDGAVLRQVAGELADVRRERAGGRWTGELAARALAAARIAGGYLLPASPAQRPLEPRERAPEGGLVRARRGRRIVVSAAVTPQRLRQAADRPPRADDLAGALEAMTRACYGQAPADDAALDRALATATRVVAELRRERGRTWPFPRRVGTPWTR